MNTNLDKVRALTAAITEIQQTAGENVSPIAELSAAIFCGVMPWLTTLEYAAAEQALEALNDLNAATCRLADMLRDENFRSLRECMLFAHKASEENRAA
jgi:hypothetical protein